MKQLIIPKVATFSLPYAFVNITWGVLFPTICLDVPYSTTIFLLPRTLLPIGFKKKKN
jgi:hypothetical protein